MQTQSRQSAEHKQRVQPARSGHAQPLHQARSQLGGDDQLGQIGQSHQSSQEVGQIASLGKRVSEYLGEQVLGGPLTEHHPQEQQRKRPGHGGAAQITR